jgi:hypothetical protein
MKCSTADFWVVGVAIISMSLGPWCGGCSGKGQGKQNGKEAPKVNLENAWGDLFSNNRLSLMIVGSLEHRLKDEDVWLSHFTAKDAMGSALPLECGWVNSKMGKAVCIKIDANGATGPVQASGFLTYGGLRYSITAAWQEQEGGQPGDWKLVQCKIVRAEAE